MVNKSILIGRLGKDPELKSVGQTSVCKFSLATTKKTGTDGDVKETTQWHNINVWGKQGENCAKYLAKGSQAYIEGEIEYRQYEKDGVKHNVTDINAHTVRFLTTKKEASNQDFPKPEAKASYTDQFDEIPF